MQSSLWKLLTAAGIIGIGTLVVLEVQTRLPVRNSTEGTVAVQATGTEISVTPDASTDFDEAMLRTDAFSPGSSDPAQYDKPGVGTGKPAPPADDSRFFGAVEDRTVRKDQLTDDASPFAVAMDEPDEEAAFPEAAGNFGQPALGEISLSEPSASPSVTPASFHFENDAPAASKTDVASAVEAEPLIPFPDETSPKVAAPKPASAAKSVTSKPAALASTANAQQPASKPAMMFFPQGSGTSAGSNSAGATTSSPAKTSAAMSSTKDSAASTSTGKRSASAPPTSVASAKTAQTVQQTSATIDEPPMMFLPESAEDDRATTGSSGRAIDETKRDETPTFDSLSFDEDSSPASSGLDMRSTPRRPMESGRGSNTSSDTQFFGEDSTENATPIRPVPDLMDEESEPLPFMPDEPVADERPRRTPPIGREPLDDPFPMPESSGRTQDDSIPFDSNLDVPFERDPNFGDSDEPLPLPSADDRNDISTRPRRNPSDRGTTGNGSATRTVSEVMRPQLTIQKKAPNTATVGVSHDYTIVVTNEGASPAYDVVVEDELGGAAEYVESKPVAEYNRSSDQLVWNFTELRPREKKEIIVRIRPTGEGTLDGIATVGFKAQVKSATVITAPKLELTLTGPDEVKVGDEVQLTYTVRNRGSGDAANIVLRSVLPPGLKHPEGGDLEYEIEILPAGESQDIDLAVVAAEPGELILVSAEITSSGVSAAKARTEIEIVGSQLTLERLGPERRYVGRTANFQNIVTNESRFEATNAILVEELPIGMRFVSASNGGVYNPDTRRIRWTIPRLGSGKQSVFDVELVAEQAGQMETMVEVTENAGFRTPLTENTVVTVEDLHNVTADISRQDEPVPVGARFGFTVTIQNRGTAVARNVALSVQVPPELRVLAAGTKDVPGQLMKGNVVTYAKVLEVMPNEEMTFELRLQGERPVKNSHVQAFLRCDEMPEALIVSESVTVYDDRP